MKGAVDILELWQKECKKHLVEPNDAQLLQCQNCKLRKQCILKRPFGWTKDDVLAIIKKVEE